MASSKLNPWLKSDFCPGLVSVIVPTYNRAKFIPKLINNVRSQDYSPIEIIIIDDGSTDETASVVRQCISEGNVEDGVSVHYFYQQHRGVSSARNTGLCISRGEFIQFLDSDDRLLPKKLAVQIKCLRSRMDLDYVYSKTAQIGSKGLCNAIIGAPMDEKKPVRNIALHLWHISGALFRRSVCVKTGLWDENLKISEDWDYAARVKSISLRGYYIPKVLSEYIIHHQGQIITDLSIDKIFSRNNAIWNVIDLIKRYGDTSRHGLDICARAMLANGITGGVLGDKHLMRQNMVAVIRLGRLSTIYAAVLLRIATFFLPISFIGASIGVARIQISKLLK